jgi:hypothetical protein
MIRHLLVGILAALLLQPAGADARGSHGGSQSTRSSSSSHSTSTRSTSKRSTTHHARSQGTRSHRTTKRDPAQRRAFQHSHPCPSTGKTSGACPGYVLDPVVPLKRGGPDRPSNMQWQTTAEAKAKDKWGVRY